jgi:D-glycero-D-manno-heptose 1,7-bisphosphate phosphatase
VALRRAGLALVVISNQGVVARGGATLEQVEAVNARLRGLLIDASGQSLIDAVYCCPFHPKGRVPLWTREHPWRKPAPGMILAAAQELSLDLSRSWLIGDAERDLAAGAAAGLDAGRCIRVGAGLDFSAAAGLILRGIG